MKLYAIRDRLLEYFQRPFIGDTDATVLAAVATAINTETNVDFAQTPTHFEVWCLAEIQEETGKVTPHPKFISNCSDLRRGIRETGFHATAQGPGPAPGRRDETREPPSDGRTPDRRPEGSTQSQTGTSGEGGEGPEGARLTS